MLSGPAPSLCPYPAAAALATAALLLVATGQDGGELLDEIAGDYHEDAPEARRVAEIRARLLRRDERLYARVLVAAQGARVEALPGLAGVQGHNLRTAEELHRLLRDDRLRFVLRGEGPVSEIEGRVAVLRTGSLPERSVRGGILRLRGRTEAEWPLEVAFEAGPLPPGGWRAYVLVDEVPRLRAVFEVGAGRGRVAELSSLGQFHDPEGTR